MSLAASEPSAPLEPPRLDDRLVWWLASEAIADRYARLVDGGADVGVHIELASLFIDLPARARPSDRMRRLPRAEAVRARPPEVDSVPIMARLLGEGNAPAGELGAPAGRWLLVGGPGSGKSTVTRMLAQQLRSAWVERHRTSLPAMLGDPWQAMQPSLVQLAAEQTWPAPGGALPLRVNLPQLARWMTGQDRERLTLWHYVAHRIVQDLDAWEIAVELDAHGLRALTKAAPILWILDGLDEVPTTAGRADMVTLVRATVCSDTRSADGVLVATRPQGYGGEFDDLEELELRPLPPELASEYAERLLGAWYRSNPPLLAEKRERLRAELAKPEVSELLRTPLHTTLAAVLIANRGSLPAARHRLFERYFDMIWRRELDKPLEQTVQESDEKIILALHERAGLILHVRAQGQEGARASLRRRELRQLLATLFTDAGYDESSAQAHVDRLMRFAVERLVLLLHAARGEYEFGVRSLQEFFAARAVLRRAAPAVVRARVEAVVLSPHWVNVLAFVTSEVALRTDPVDRDAGLAATVEPCRALAEGAVGGPAAARCSLGARLAMQMLEETERYGHPWLHDSLWELALAAAKAPVQQRAADYHPVEASRNGWSNAEEPHTRLGALAGAWSKPGGDELRQRVLEHAREALLSPDAGEHDRGWRLLHGLLSAQMPEAIELADRCAPQTREGAQHLFEVLGGGVEPPPPWLGRYVDRHPDLFFGFEFFDVRFLFRIGPGGELDSLVFRLARQLTTQSRIELHADQWTISLASLPIDDDVDLTTHIPSEPGWMCWRQLAAFIGSPSHSTLADLLDVLDDESFRSLRLDHWQLPWPLGACFRAATNLDEIGSFSAMLRSGALGRLDDWTAAEARWRAHPSVSTDDLLSSLGCHGPWNPDIAVRGVPLIDMHMGMGPIMLPILLQRLELEGSLSPKEQVLLRPLTFEVVVPLHVAHLVQRFENGLWPLPLPSLQAGFESADRDEWMNLLDRRGREGPVVSFRYNLDEETSARIWLASCERLQTRPDQLGLIEILRALLSDRFFPDVDLSKLVLPPLPEDAPVHLLDAAALLRLVAGHFEPADRPDLLDRLGDRVEELAALLEHQPPETATELLLAALDHFPTSTHRDALLGSLYLLTLRQAPAAFDTPDTWAHHALPSPYLGLSLPPPTSPRLRRISELTNLRLFKTTPIIDAPFPTPPADRGQWIVLVGENGSGKTTLLRALALALASPPVASKLLDERLPMVRNGGSGQVSIELDSGELSVTVSRKGRTEQVESRTSHAERPWVVGYGVRRGNARGESDRDAEVGALGELHTLFDRPASLHNATQWIAELDADVLREQRNAEQGAKPGPREQVWRAVLRALEGLLGITKVEVADGGLVFVEHRQLGRVRLDALSDGYLTTAGWVIDMIARWVDRQYELDEPIGPQLLHQMCGLVLIDELDLHLHPTWQLRIIDDVRRLFPRLSFVVTTHNPLTLQGARPGEVFIMRREGERIELIQRDIRPWHDVDRVLLEQFGLPYTYDRETRDLLERHRKLVETGVALDDPERVGLELRLRERFGDVGEPFGHEREHGLSGPLTAAERERFFADYADRED